MTSSMSGHASSGTPRCSWPSKITVRRLAGSSRVSGMASSANSTATMAAPWARWCSIQPSFDRSSQWMCGRRRSVSPRLERPPIVIGGGDGDARADGIAGSEQRSEVRLVGNPQRRDDEMVPATVLAAPPGSSYLARAGLGARRHVAGGQLLASFIEGALCGGAEPSARPTERAACELREGQAQSKSGPGGQSVGRRRARAESCRVSGTRTGLVAWVAGWRGSDSPASLEHDRYPLRRGRAAMIWVHGSA